MLRKILIVLVILACPAFADDKPHVWHYSILTRATFATTDKQMWICPEKKLDGQTKVPDTLKAMGEDGWELVAITVDTRSDPEITSYYFKKP